MEWRSQQQLFWDWITRPQDLRQSQAQIDELFVKPSGISRTEALAIYNNAFHQRLIQIAGQMYPVLYHTLGAEVFAQLWLSYLGEHLPRPGPMRNMSEDLQAFVQQHEQFGRLPALHDIIRVEILLLELFDRLDEPALSREQLQQLPPQQWPDKVWQPRQDWALVGSHFDLETYWRLMHDYIDADGVAGEAPFGVQRLDEGQRYFLLRRHDYRMQLMSISDELALFLQGIEQGHSFAQICEALARQHPAEEIPALSLKLLLRTIELQLLHAEPAVLVAEQ